MKTKIITQLDELNNLSSFTRKDIEKTLNFSSEEAYTFIDFLFKNKIIEILKFGEADEKTINSINDETEFIDLLNDIEQGSIFKFNNKILSEKELDLINYFENNQIVITINNSILSTEKITISLIQRFLVYGFPKALRFIRFLEENLYITKAEPNIASRESLHKEFTNQDFEKWIANEKIILSQKV